eukprot:scaffold9973_cov19-Tisochrysis_lutea.AAC.3
MRVRQLGGEEAATNRAEAWVSSLREWGWQGFLNLLNPLKAMLASFTAAMGACAYACLQERAQQYQAAGETGQKPEPVIPNPVSLHIRKHHGFCTNRPAVKCADM